MSSLIPIVAIVGPTGAGKTALAVRLAKRFRGEIIGADSRQVYRHMDIGTGKPTLEEREGVPHHVIDAVDPDEDFSVARFQGMAGNAVSDLHARQKVPFLVGGSGHYVWALLEGLRVPRVPPDECLRRELAAVSAREGGVDLLHRMLSEVDSAGAERIDPRNVRRVIRAIEVSRATGTPFSQVGKREPPPYEPLIIGLTQERAALYRRIDKRIEEMFHGGWVGEVRRLLKMGYGLELPSMSGFGYKEIVRHLGGELELGAAIDRTKTATHRFVRHQYSWFRASDPRISWIDITDDPYPAVERAITKFLV